MAESRNKKVSGEKYIIIYDQKKYNSHGANENRTTGEYLCAVTHQSVVILSGFTTIKY